MLAEFKQQQQQIRFRIFSRNFCWFAQCKWHSWPFGLHEIKMRQLAASGLWPLAKSRWSTTSLPLAIVVDKGGRDE